jgi:hypothetical protein
MYDCVTGQQIENSYGCIMADEMVNRKWNTGFSILLTTSIHILFNL